VREYATPLTGDAAADLTGNLTDDVVRNGELHGDTIAFSRRVEGAWQDVTAAQFLTEVRAVAKGLIAAGVEPGPMLGRALSETLRAKLDGEVDGREDELRYALQVAR
jgi:hypothetical protein